MSVKRLSDEERAELVAYLDGEATGDAKRAVEAKLSLDPSWRAEAESLKRTWDLLDFLPRPEPKADFTQRTISKLNPIRRPGGSSIGGPTPSVRWLLIGAWAASLLVAALTGYFGSRAALPSGPGDAELTRDLRIIENKRYYDLIDDFDFLTDLDDPDLFGDDDGGGFERVTDSE
jgi:anti-sigma factor RsiW